MIGSSLDEDDEVMSEINMTPLVDVMLVLLIIFIITIPVINHAVKIDLPRATSQPNEVKSENVNLMIDNNGKVFWNDIAVDDITLKERMDKSAQRIPQPELHLQADRKTPYEKIAQVMSTAQSAGLSKMGFVTQPGKE